jgi:hypothetical protein
VFRAHSIMPLDDQLRKRGIHASLLRRRIIEMPGDARARTRFGACSGSLHDTITTWVRSTRTALYAISFYLITYAFLIHVTNRFVVVILTCGTQQPNVIKYNYSLGILCILAS